MAQYDALTDAFNSFNNAIRSQQSWKEENAANDAKQRRSDEMLKSNLLDRELTRAQTNLRMANTMQNDAFAQGMARKENDRADQRMNNANAVASRAAGEYEFGKSLRDFETRQTEANAINAEQENELKKQDIILKTAEADKVTEYVTPVEQDLSSYINNNKEAFENPEFANGVVDILGATTIGRDEEGKAWIEDAAGNMKISPVDMEEKFIPQIEAFKITFQNPKQEIEEGHAQRTARINELNRVIATKDPERDKGFLANSKVLKNKMEGWMQRNPKWTPEQEIDHLREQAEIMRAQSIATRSAVPANKYAARAQALDNNADKIQATLLQQSTAAAKVAAEKEKVLRSAKDIAKENITKLEKHTAEMYNSGVGDRGEYVYEPNIRVVRDIHNDILEKFVLANPLAKEADALAHAKTEMQEKIPAYTAKLKTLDRLRDQHEIVVGSGIFDGPERKEWASPEGQKKYENAVALINKEMTQELGRTITPEVGEAYMEYQKGSD